MTTPPPHIDPVRWIGLFVFALVIYAVLAPLARSQAPSPPSDVDGTWQLATPGAERQIDRAIERVTSRLNVFIRGIARSRIDETVNPERRIRIQQDDGLARVSFDDWTVRVRLGDRPRRVRIGSGEALLVSGAVRNGRLTIVQTASEGSRVSYFGLRNGRMQMATRIRSERLPEDIVYHLSYDRVGDRRVASR